MGWDGTRYVTGDVSEILGRQAEIDTIDVSLHGVTNILFIACFGETALWLSVVNLIIMLLIVLPPSR